MVLGPPSVCKSFKSNLEVFYQFQANIFQRLDIPKNLRMFFRAVSNYYFIILDFDELVDSSCRNCRKTNVCFTFRHLTL